MKLFENYDFTGKIKTFEEFKPPFDRNTVSDVQKKKIKEAADIAASEEVPMLLAARYRDFVRNGNRTRYEAPYFVRRRSMFSSANPTSLRNLAASAPSIALWSTVRERPIAG